MASAPAMLTLDTTATTIFCHSSNQWRLKPHKLPFPQLFLSARKNPALLSAPLRVIRSQSGVSAQSQAPLDGETENVRKCLHDLAETLVLPPDFLSKLPEDLKVDLNDAAFALSSGPLNQECGDKVAELVMGLSRAWEQRDTQTTTALASEIPSLQEVLQSDQFSTAALGKRMKAAGRYLASTGQYGDGELQKLSKALVAAGEAFALSSPNPPDKPPSKDGTRTFKFGDLQLQLTAQNAYIGAAIALAFGLLSWGLTSSIQNVVANPTQYANDNSFFVATSLRGTLLSAGYFCTIMSAVSMVGLLALASQLGSRDHSS